MAVTVKINDAGLVAKMQAIIDAGQSTAMFRVIGNVVVARVRLCFKFGIDPWGNPWAALKYRKGQPLVLTGRLRSSIVAKPDPKGVSIGTNLAYAPAHQYGMGTVRSHTRLIKQAFGKPLAFPVYALIKEHDANVPARPFLPLRSPAGQAVLPPAWSVAVVRSLKSYFLTAIKAA